MKENKKKNPLQALSALLLLLVLLLHSGCADDKKADVPGGGEGNHTVRLTLSVSTTPIPETKAVVQRARPGSEAEAAGFSYELVSSDTDTTATAVLTKAPSTLKNVYALLFTNTGAFNGRADLGTVASSTEKTIVFENVATPDAAGCRLVIVANDNAATNSYASTGGTGNFINFKGTYSEFQALTITNAVSTDVDIPYAGSITVNLTNINNGSSAAKVSLYRTLAKVTLNNTVSITGGPARSSITLYNAGTRRFATTGDDDYNGTGTTETSGFVESTPGNNAASNTWYVGENIRPAGSGIKSISDRNSKNAPKNACYIRIATAAMSIAANINPAIGQEYIMSGSRSFTYDIYLGRSSDPSDFSDFSLRRHTNYTITSNVSGTVASQETLAASDGRVTLSKTGGSSGLNIGLLGGATGYTTGTGTVSTITGSYTKNVLLQPNTSGSTATDNVSRKWSDNTTTQLQPENRRYWDPTYTLANIDQTSGTAYDYCKNLNVNGLTGWYLPSQAQWSAIYDIYEYIKGNSSYANYKAFDATYYWSSTESGASNSWYVRFVNGYVYNFDKSYNNSVRCVRDIE